MRNNKGVFHVRLNERLIAVKYDYVNAKRTIKQTLVKELKPANITYLQCTESMKTGGIFTETWRNYRTGETYNFTIEKQPSE